MKKDRVIGDYISALNIQYYIQYCKPKEYGNYDLWVGVDLKN